MLSTHLSENLTYNSIARDCYTYNAAKLDVTAAATRLISHTLSLQVAMLSLFRPKGRTSLKNNRELNIYDDNKNVISIINYLLFHTTCQLR